MSQVRLRLCQDIVWRGILSSREEGPDMPATETRNEKLDLRLTPSAKRTLQPARAEETLPDRQRFGLGAEQWATFQAVLDAHAPPAPRLTKLLREPSVFERGRKK